MKYSINIILSMILLSGCALNENSDDIDIQEMQGGQTFAQKVGERYAEKQLAYEEQQHPLTFTGEVDDFDNVILTTDHMMVGLPYKYQFIQLGDELELTVWSISEDTSDDESVYEVESLEYENGRYVVQVSEETFEFYTLNESVKRLKDNENRFYSAEYYIPEALSDQWMEEARKEVKEAS
ncbi:hypothetical protein [Marinilactibacillus kalidii]|uniref:hypothetical protein n=1 Tax=Marinilactibacillus kalidii TaxID=2820274 RepID=UPI001ABEE6A5|nr:hypothetical protein [Marinilactibacillus kalidii]